VASASKQVVIIADETKEVRVLGKFGLPVEVVKFAQAVVRKKIEALGAKVSMRQSGSVPFLTDENNYILDCHFGEITDTDGLARELSDMPGVVEHGLFIGMASVVIVARGREIVELRRGE
jgi:ribose 5-phosphate isomerase A